MELKIDTTAYGEVVFELSGAGKNIKESFAVKPHESANILGYLDKFLKKSKIKNPQSEILKIIVYKGSGSFTGLRIGAAVAEALSLAWGVKTKVVNKK